MRAPFDVWLNETVQAGGSASSWKAFLTGLKRRGLSGVEFVVSDDYAGLKRAGAEPLPEAVWQRCYVHFLRKALDDLPRKADDDCLGELRRVADRGDLKEAQQGLQAWLQGWQRRYPKLTDRVQAHIGRTLNLHVLPRQHHKHLNAECRIGRSAGPLWYSIGCWDYCSSADGSWRRGVVGPSARTTGMSTSLRRKNQGMKGGL